MVAELRRVRIYHRKACTRLTEVRRDSFDRRNRLMEVLRVSFDHHKVCSRLESFAEYF